MHNMKRIVYGVSGAVCLMMAGLLVITAGLPERAAVSRHVDEGGVWVAPEVGALAPVFTAQTADGTHVSLVALRGQAVVLNFWATWCGPCRVEMPELEALHAAYGESGLAIIGMNTGEALEDVLDWRDNYTLTFPLALDPDGAVSELYALRGQPTTFVIGPDGRIVQIAYGPATRAMLEAALQPFIGAA